MVRAMCEVQFKDRKRAKDLMMLDSNETIDQMTMANSVSSLGHVLRREDSYVLRRALNFEVEGQKRIRS